MKTINKIQFTYSVILAAFAALLIGSAVGSPIVAGIVFAGSLGVSYAYRKEQGLALMACGSATMNMIADPCNISTGGQEVTVRVFNRTDITGYTYASGNDYIIEDITMSGAALGFRYKGLVNTNNFKSESVELNFTTMWKTTGTIMLWSNNGAAIKEMDSALVKGDLVIVVENKDKGTAGDAAFDVHGVDVGLRATKVTRDPSSNDNQGAWLVEFGPPKNQYEKKPVRKFYKTSYAVSLGLLDDVTTPE